MRPSLFILTLFIASVPCLGQTRAPATGPAAGATTVPTREKLDAAVAKFAAAIESSPNDDPLRQKLVERHNTAVRFLQLRIDSFHHGTADATEVFDAARIVAEAKAGLAQSTDERRSVLRQHIELLRMAEAGLEQQWRAGLTAEVSLQSARLARESAEIELLRAERNSGESAPTTRPR